MNHLVLAILCLTLPLLLLLYPESLWLRKRQVYTDYHDMLLHVYCDSEILGAVLHKVEDSGCTIISCSITEEVPIHKAVQGCSLAVLLNIDTEGRPERFPGLLHDIANLPSVHSAGEGKPINE